MKPSSLRTVTAVIGVVLAFSPLVAGAQSLYVSLGTTDSSDCGTGSLAGSETICSLASTVFTIIDDVAVPVLFAIAFIVFIWGVARAYILSGGDEEAIKEGHRLILWGIIGFVVMVSLWGIVNVVADTVGLTNASAPTPPTI